MRKFWLVLTVVAGLTSVLASAAEVAGKRCVWAHNTPWFRPEDYSLYTTMFYNYPLASAQDGRDIRRNTLREEFKQALAMGIDGMFLDLGADPNKKQMHWSFIVKQYLEAAEGLPFYIGICRDSRNMGVDYESSELIRILKENANHPNYPHYNGRPMVFTYVYRSAFKPEEYQDVRKRLKDAGFDIFLVPNFYPWPFQTIDIPELERFVDTYDGLYMFDAPTANTAKADVQNNVMAEFAKKHGKVFFPTLYPGYLTEWMHGNDFYGPHRGYDVLFMTLDAALATPGVQQFHLSTWNDLFETAVLPRVFSPGRAPAVAYCCKVLKGENPRVKTPEILLGYHREEIVGTLLRIEAVSLPMEKAGTITVEGVLEDKDGAVVETLPTRTLSADRLDKTEWVVSTVKLAKTPVLTPRLTITCGAFKKAVTAPSVMLVSSWLQNPVTVNVSSTQLLADFPNTLRVKREGNTVRADISFKCPKALRRITLFRNDRPIGLFTPDVAPTEAVIPMMFGPDLDVEIEHGRILRAMKKGGNYNGAPGFSWTKTAIHSRYQSGGNAMTVAGTNDLTFVVKPTNGQPAVRIAAAQLAREKLLRGAGWDVRLTPETTGVCEPQQPLPNGAMSLAVFSPESNPTDMYFVRYETTDGDYLMTPPIFPFSPANALAKTMILETTITLEGTAGATALSLNDEGEFLTPPAELPVAGAKTAVPVRPSTRKGVHPPVRICNVVPAFVSTLGARSALWHFDGNDVDYASDHHATESVAMPAAMYVQGGFDGKGQCLKFTRNEQIILRKRAWPMGGAGRIHFYLNPAAFDGKKQSVVYKRGWQDGLSINLLEDGRVEVVRNYSKDDTSNAVEERLIGKTALKPGEWSRIETRGDASRLELYVNGRLDGTLELTPCRSYGDETIFLGGGEPNYARYAGKLDEFGLNGL